MTYADARHVARVTKLDLDWERRTPSFKHGFKVGFEAGLIVAGGSIAIIASLTLLVIAALS